MEVKVVPWEWIEMGQKVMFSHLLKHHDLKYIYIYTHTHIYAHTYTCMCVHIYIKYYMLNIFPEKKPGNRGLNDLGINIQTKMTYKLL